MKLYVVAGCYLIAQAAAAPLEIPVYFKATPYATESSIEFAKRQDWFACEYPSPNDRMPLVSDANVIADYLQSQGADGDCSIERGAGSGDQVYRVWIYGQSEVSIYFTQKAENWSVFRASYYCDYLAGYLRNLVNTCQTDGRAQGSTEVPNCPNKGISWVNEAPTAEGGAGIEFMPRGTRSSVQFSTEAVDTVQDITVTVP